MLKKWKLLNSEKVFESSFITLYQEELERADGKVVKNFYSVKRRDAVYIVAVTSDKKVPLVYQYKNGVKDLIYELPAGFIEDGETVLESGIRELQEETGFAAEKFVELGSFVPNPSISANRNFVILGLEAQKKYEQRLDSNEQIQVELFDLEKLIGEIKERRSKLIGSQDQLALLLVWEELNK